MKHTQRRNSGPKGLCTTVAGTSISRPRLISQARAKVFVGASLALPLAPPVDEEKIGDRAFCHSAHTRPSTRGEVSFRLVEDQMLTLKCLSLSKKSSTARGARHRPEPLRRRERKITTLIIASDAIEN